MRKCGHNPVVIAQLSYDKDGNALEGENRGKCRLCHIKCATLCGKCDVYLCVDIIRKCYEKFHTDLDPFPSVNPKV